MDDKIKHCCIYMDYALSGENGYLIEYTPETRSYTLRFYEEDEFTGMEKALWYCPWCGKKLPKKLLDEIEDVLEKEYGITGKDLNNDEIIPLEFRTDAWWKKRSL